MTTFSGKGVYGAVALGKVSVFKRRETTVKMLHVDDTEAEKARLAAAKEAATAQLQEIYDTHHGAQRFLHQRQLF